MSTSTNRLDWTENRPTRGFRGLDFRELWTYRELAVFLALRDLKVRYKQAAFGVAWALLQPLAGMIVFTIVFRRLANIPSNGIPYPVFAFVGLTAWVYISGAVTKATEIFVENASLITKVYFPRLLAPIAGVLPGLLDVLINLVLLTALMIGYGVAPDLLALLTAPLWIVAGLFLSLGVGLWFGTLNVRYRDVAHAIPLFVQLWLFISPVAYPLSTVPDGWRFAYSLNPVAGIVEGFRWALVGGPWAGGYVFVSLGMVIAILASGLVYFQRSERRFADVI